MTDFPDWGVDESVISAINTLTTAINGLRAGFGSTAFAELTPFAQSFTVGGSGILLAAPGANLRYYVASVQAQWGPSSLNNVLRGTLNMGIQCGSAVFLAATLTPDNPATDVVVPGAAVAGDVNQPITWNSVTNGVASSDAVTIAFLYTIGAQVGLLDFPEISKANIAGTTNAVINTLTTVTVVAAPGAGTRIRVYWVAMAIDLSSAAPAANATITARIGNMPSLCWAISYPQQPSVFLFLPMGAAFGAASALNVQTWASAVSMNFIVGTGYTVETV